MKLQMTTLKANGATIEYIESGLKEKQSLVLIHGSLSDYRIWSMQMEPFSERFHVIAYSRRCHYPNPWVEYPSDYSVKTECDDLESLIKSLGIAPVNIVASSFGAFIALVLARNRPELIKSLVLGEPPVLALLESDPKTSSLYLEFSSKLKSAITKIRGGQYEEGVRAFINAVNGEGAFEALPTNAKKSALDNVRPLPFQSSNPQRDPFTCEDARTIQSPVLLLNGANSPEFHKTLTMQLASCLPNCTHEVVSKSSHAMHVQNPREYNKIVLEFLLDHS
jgi:non-heme chloroperoxidase